MTSTYQLLRLVNTRICYLSILCWIFVVATDFVHGQNTADLDEMCDPINGTVTCSTPNSRCMVLSSNTARCQCIKGSLRDNLKCTAIIGHDCNPEIEFDACPDFVPNSYCAPDAKSCQCINGYVTDIDSLCEAILGHDCNPTVEIDVCTGLLPNSYCAPDVNVCQCRNGYHVTNNDSLCEAILGHDCNPTVEIDVCTGLLPNSYCAPDVNVCQCRNGYHVTNIHSLCEANGQSCDPKSVTDSCSSTDSNTECIATVPDESNIGTCQCRNGMLNVSSGCLGCVLLPSPANGQVTTDIETNGYASVATYTCNGGYMMVGQDTRTCQENNTWSGYIPTCKQRALRCGPALDARGTTWNETVAGSTAQIVCPYNYTGNVTRTCSLDGVWLSPRYNCVREYVEQIQNEIKELNVNSSDKDIANTLQKMASVTTTTIKENITLTESEVKIIVNGLETVSNILIRRNITTEISNLFVDSADNLLDRYNKPTWKSLDEFTDGTAERLVSAVGTLSHTLTTQLEKSSTNTIVIANQNIVIEIKITNGTDIVFPTNVSGQNWVTEGTSYIRIPKEALPDGNIVSVGIMFRNMSEIMPANTKESSDTKNNRSVNGPVLSLTITPELQTLTPPLRIVFEHSLTGYSHPECSFWTFQTNSSGYWSGEGCSLVETSYTHTTCECDHLTNFAVLMSPFKEAAVDDTALRVVSIIGISVSMLCLSLTLCIHVYLWRLIKNDRAVILTNLCTALIIAYVVFLAGVDRTEQKAVCVLIAALLQYIYLVVFCIMLVEGIVVALTVLFVFVKKYRTKLLLALAWAVPAVITCISLAITRTEGYGNESFCWLSIDNGLIYAFVAPALAVILINIIVICLVLRAMLQTRTVVKMKKKIDKIKISIRSLCVLVPLMGVSWVLGILYINDNLYWMQYVFAVCNGLQGFFIFLFHCALNEQVRIALRELIRRKASVAWTADITASNTDDTKGYNKTNTSKGPEDKHEYPANNDTSYENNDVLMEYEIAREITTTKSKTESTGVYTDHGNSPFRGSDITIYDNNVLKETSRFRGSDITIYDNKFLKESINDHSIDNNHDDNGGNGPNICVRTIRKSLNFSTEKKLEHENDANNYDGTSLCSNNTLQHIYTPSNNGNSSESNIGTVVDNSNSQEGFTDRPYSTINSHTSIMSRLYSSNTDQSIEDSANSYNDPKVIVIDNSKTNARTNEISTDGNHDITTKADKNFSGRLHTSKNLEDSNSDIISVVMKITNPNSTLKEIKSTIDSRHTSESTTSTYNNLLADVYKLTNLESRENWNTSISEGCMDICTNLTADVNTNTRTKYTNSQKTNDKSTESANDLMSENNKFTNTNASARGNPKESYTALISDVNNLSNLDVNGSPNENPKESNTDLSTDVNNITNIDAIGGPQTNKSPTDSNTDLSTDVNNILVTNLDAIGGPQTNKSPTDSNTDLSTDVNNLTNIDAIGGPQTNKSPTDSNTDLSTDVNNITNLDAIGGPQTNKSPTDSNTDLSTDVNNITNLDAIGGPQTNKSPADSNTDLSTDVNNITNLNVRSNLQTYENPTDSNIDLSTDVNKIINLNALKST